MFNPGTFWSYVGWSLNSYICGVESIYVLGGLYPQKIYPKEKQHQSVATNPPTGCSTLILFLFHPGDTWTILSLAQEDFTYVIVDLKNNLGNLSSVSVDITSVEKNACLIMWQL